MSKLRPTLRSCNEPGLSYSATYYRVLDAVSARRSLIHGKLEDGTGHFCAIGAYFDESTTAINSQAIDEIAAYNDSFPHLSTKERWRKVQSWLRFQVQAMLPKKPVKSKARSA